ncbi:unnamed protein product [Arabidopsis lyrata]|nr:unnamed protein product [Arabidopsis lyrata]
MMRQTKYISKKKQLECSRQVRASPVSTKDQEGQTKRSEFIQRP